MKHLLHGAVLLLAIVLAGSLLGGCTSLSERKQSTALQDTLRNYSGIIRWGALEKAYAFRDPASSEEPDDIPTDLDNIRVTSYEVVQGPAMTNESTAIQTVIIEYLHRDLQIIKRIQDKQVWRYDKEKMSWHLASKVPQFK